MFSVLILCTLELYHCPTLWTNACFLDFVLCISFCHSSEKFGYQQEIKLAQILFNRCHLSICRIKTTSWVSHNPRRFIISEQCLPQNVIFSDTPPFFLSVVLIALVPAKSIFRNSLFNYIFVVEHWTESVRKLLPRIDKI